MTVSNLKMAPARPAPREQDLMTEALKERDHYLAEFGRIDPSQREPAELRQWRDEAMERFAGLGFPSAEDEEWRFTNLTPLRRTPFRLAGEGKISAQDFSQIDLIDATWPRLTFVNGRFSPELSLVGQAARVPAGVTFTNLAAVMGQGREWISRLGKHGDWQNHPFYALNAGFFRDGPLIHLGPGVVADQPLHLLFLSVGDGPVVSHPRTLVVLGQNASASIIETHLGIGGRPYFTNAVTEITLEANARLDHCKLQFESEASYHVAAMQVRQERSSVLSSHSVSFGGSISRNDIRSELAGEFCECTLNGLYMASGQQLMDNHTRIDHSKPNCASHELYKGILGGTARGVFNGKIYVHPDAQKTDAKQTNKTLLLSPDATINTKPELEIYADDVKCTHGATIGQLSDEEIFYLRSRGIGKQDALSLLTFAFANDIVSRIPVEPIRSRLERRLVEGTRRNQTDGMVPA